MYARWKRLGNLGIDDFLIVLSLACLIGDLIIQQHMWNLGLGDMSTVTPENLKGIMQMIIPGSTLYVSSLWAIKFALVFFYKKLTAPGSRLVLVYNLTFQCFPHNKRWSNDPSCEQTLSHMHEKDSNDAQINAVPKPPRSTTGSPSSSTSLQM
jgi:hypothetical protein